MTSILPSFRRLSTLMAAVFIGWFAVPLCAQDHSVAGDGLALSTTTTDAYGNARSALSDHRPIGLFWLDTNRANGTGVLQNTRDRRSGDTLFSLPGDLLGLMTVQTLSDTISPGLLREIPQKKAQAFREYGGFGRRDENKLQDPIAQAFARRFSLTAATSLAAPVYRALAENSSMAGVRSAVVRTPFVEGSVSDPLGAPVSLFDRLERTTSRSLARAKDEAWGLFLDGAYRPSGRAFQSVLVLAPDDIEARIAEMFCHVQIGAIRTAMAITYSLSRHTDNVFSARVDMRSHYGEPREPDQLGVNARLALESVSPGRIVDLDATYVLVLWYLGKRDEAVRFGLVLSGQTGAAHYADWPAKMNEVLQRGAEGQTTQ